MSSQLQYFGFDRGTWNFFEAGHGKGAADGVGAALKRKADKLIAFGNDIKDAHQFYEMIRHDTKVKMFFIEEQDIDFFEVAVPNNLPTLKGTMNIHQIATTLQNTKLIKYRDISCFCGEDRGLCDCFQYKSFLIENCGINEKNERNEEYSETAMNSKLLNPECFEDVNEIMTDKIIKGTYILVEFVSEKKRKTKYYYIAVAQDDLEDDGEVKVMFLKACDNTLTIFKLDDNDVAYISFEQIQKILPMPTVIQKGDRLFYKFPYPIEVFEK